MKDRFTGLLIGGISGGVVALAFPPLALSPLAYVALVPLFARIRATGGRRVILPFLAFSLVHFSVVLYWLSPVITPIGVVILAAIVWFVFHLPMGILLGYLLRRGLPLSLAAPTIWVAFDWLRTWLFSGFPWLFLAHSQADFTTLIQISDVTGAHGITALVVLVNAALAGSWSGPWRRRLVPVGIAAGVTALVLLYGVVRIGTVSSREGPVILLVQGCIPQGDKRRVREREDAGEDIAQSIFDAHLKLTRDGVAKHPETEIVIWPETMFPFRIDDRPGLSPYYPSWLRNKLLGITRAAGGRPVLFGSLYRTKDGEGRNSVFLLDGRGQLTGRYDKLHTVPGGEHVPLHTILPSSATTWIGETIARFSGYYPDLTEGDGPVILAAGNARFSPLVCYEIIYPELVRGTMDLKPDVLLNLSNYAWYPDTHQPEQAEDITIFRAVENRRPVVVSANNGISSIIDATGVVRDSIARDFTGTLSGRLPLTGSRSWYARVGDVFSWLCAGLVALLVAGGVYCRRRAAAPGGR